MGHQGHVCEGSVWKQIDLYNRHQHLTKTMEPMPSAAKPLRFPRGARDARLGVRPLGGNSGRVEPRPHRDITIQVFACGGMSH